MAPTYDPNDPRSYAPQDGAPDDPYGRQSAPRVRPPQRSAVGSVLLVMAVALGTGLVTSAALGAGRPRARRPADAPDETAPNGGTDTPALGGDSSPSLLDNLLGDGGSSGHGAAANTTAWDHPHPVGCAFPLLGTSNTYANGTAARVTGHLSRGTRVTIREQGTKTRGTNRLCRVAVAGRSAEVWVYIGANEIAQCPADQGAENLPPVVPRTTVVQPSMPGLSDVAPDASVYASTVASAVAEMPGVVGCTLGLLGTSNTFAAATGGRATGRLARGTRVTIRALGPDTGAATRRYRVAVTGRAAEVWVHLGANELALCGVSPGGALDPADEAIDAATLGLDSDRESGVVPEGPAFTMYRGDPAPAAPSRARDAGPTLAPPLRALGMELRMAPGLPPAAAVALPPGRWSHGSAYAREHDAMDLALGSDACDGD